MFFRRRVALVAVVSALSFVVVAPVQAVAAPAKDPVIVVTGFTTGPLVEPGYWPLVARLEADGYDTTLVSYPDYGIGDIHTQAARLGDAVASVKARTGATRVDLVAHSMGGLVSRDYIKNLGGAANVDSLVMLGTPNNGTLLAAVGTFLTFGSCLGITACRQMATGSSFLAQLNAGDASPGGVSYTDITTRVDELVIPYTSAFLPTDGNVSNVVVQNQCWLRWPGHLGLILDGAVYDGVRDALRHETVRMNCFAF